METKCRLCGWQGKASEIVYKDVGHDEIGLVEHCPECDANNVDQKIPLLVPFEKMFTEREMGIPDVQYILDGAKLLSKIQAAYILGYVLAALSVMMLFITGNEYALLDIAIMAVCSTFMWRRQSRAAATVLFLTQAFARGMGLFDPAGITPTHIVLGVVFMWIFWRGMMATYEMHKLRMSNVTEVKAEVIK